MATDGKTDNENSTDENATLDARLTQFFYLTIPNDEVPLPVRYMLTHHVQGTRNRRHSTSSNVQKCSCQIYRCTSLCHLPNGSSRSRNQGEYDESSHRAFFFLMSVVRPSFSTLVSFSSQRKRSSLKSVGMAEKHRYRKLFSLRIAKVRISLKKAEVDSARDSSGQPAGVNSVF